MAAEDPNGINNNRILKRAIETGTRNKVATNFRQKQFENYEQTVSEQGIEVNNKKIKSRSTYENSNFSVPRSASEIKPNKRNADLMESAENRLTKGANAKAGGAFKRFGYKALGLGTLGAIAVGTIGNIMNAGGRKTNAQLYSDPYA